MGEVKDEDIEERLSVILNLSNKLIDEYTKVTRLDLSNSNIKELPENVVQLVSLQSLKADQNLIETLPPSFGQLIELRVLSMAHNKLSSLPDSFVNLHFLEILDLSHNNFVQSPLVLEAGCSGIVKLYMSHNFLLEWQSRPLCARTIKELDVSHNNLESNPAWIWEDACHFLEKLDLSENSFRTSSWGTPARHVWQKGVPESLISLNMSNCGLTCKDLIVMHKCKFLTYLNIGNNKGETRRDKIRQPKNYLKNALSELLFKPFECKFYLRELILSSLDLPILPDDICYLESLEVVDCSFNDLQWLPDTFCRLSKLQSAVFTSNKLSYLPEDISSLKSLRELWLAFNQIEDLPPSISDLQELRWLDLYSNCLEELPTGVEKLMPNLLGLDLGFNFFSLQSEQEMSNKYNLLKVSIWNHPQIRLKQSLERNDHLRPKDEMYSSSSDEEKDMEDIISSPSDSEISREVENAEDEVWDLEEDENDIFDPTSLPEVLCASIPSHPQASYSLSNSIFCPADIHAPSVKPCKVHFQPNDGQFDDA